MSEHDSLYDVIKEESFIQELDLLSQEFPEFKELTKFLHHHLAVQPLEFKHLSGDRYYLNTGDLLDSFALLSSGRVSKFPPAIVIFEVDQKNKIVAIKKIKMLEI